MAIPRLDSETTGVLIIDVQEKLMPSIVQAAQVENNCAQLLRMADELEMPYWVTEQYPRGLGRTTATVTAAMADRSRRVEKTRFSAAIDIIFDELEASGRRTVIIGGVEAQVCVLQTVLDLHQAGYQCFVCRDAVSGGQLDQVQPAYERMQQAGAVVTGVISAMYELLGDARHSSFGACLEIAKSVEH